MREQFRLYPILAGVTIMVIAHPSGLGMFPLVALVAPVLVLNQCRICRVHRPSSSTKTAGRRPIEWILCFAGLRHRSIHTALLTMSSSNAAAPGKLPTGATRPAWQMDFEHPLVSGLKSTRS